jgi:hypothetical protein
MTLRCHSQVPASDRADGCGRTRSLRCSRHRAGRSSGVEFASAAETAFIFNTLLFLIGGFLVMWMAAGFAMLEAGLVRSKNVSMQCLKNIAPRHRSFRARWLSASSSGRS